MPDFQPDLAALDRVFNQAPGVVRETPADWQKQAAAAQAAQGLAQEQRAKAQKATEERADQALLQQVAQEAKGDPEQISVLLGTRAPHLKLKFDEDWAKVRKSNIDLITADNKHQREQLGKHLGLLKMLERRPDLYPTVRATIAKEDPTMDPYLPAEYDPVKIAPLFQMAHDAASILDTDKQALQYLVDGKWHQAAAMAFADKTMDAEEVAAKAAELVQMGVPRQVVDSFDWQHWTPDFAARALEMGRTPEQRADAAAKAKTDKVDEELRRAQLKVSEGQLAVSQGNLGVSRQNAQRLAAQAAKPAGSGGAGGGSDVAEFVDAYMAGDKDVLRGLTPTMSTKVRAEILRRGGSLPASAVADGKPSTAVEKTALGFFERARQADEAVELIESEIAGMGFAGQARLEYAPNPMQSVTNQKYQQAQRAFTEARLRKESGAAISQSEYQNDRLIYFAKPGDSPEVLEQKRRARATILANLAFQSGRALRESYGDDADGLVTKYRAREKGGSPTAEPSTTSTPTPVAPRTTTASTPPREWRYNLKTGKKEEVK